LLNIASSDAGSIVVEDVRIVVELRRRSPLDDQPVVRLGDLLPVVGRRGNGQGVTFDRDDELGEVAVADAATSAAPIAVLRFIRALLTISFPLHLIPRFGWSRAAATARKEGLASQRPLRGGCLRRAYGRDFDSLNSRRYALVPDVSNVPQGA
jgi:hypothetical protein